MDNNNENDAQGGVRHLPASLSNIPNLPFDIICSSLDTSTFMNIPLVCKKFNSYINNIPLETWEKRAKNIWSDAVYPILSPENPDKLFWRMSCVALQKRKALCTQSAHPLVRIDRKNIHIIEIGYPLASLLLIRKHDDIVYIAAKGRSLFYKNINSARSDICIEAHRKPITGLTILSNKIYSCSTDNEPVKSWDLNGNLQMETSYNFVSGPVRDSPTCLSSNSGQYNFAVGSLYGYVTVFDSRVRDYVDRYPMCERDQSMICTLAMNSNYILSASYYNKVFAYDQRNKQITDINIPGVVTCMKMQQNCALIGDCFGKLHVLNPKNKCELIKSYDIGHTSRITGMHLTYGNLITSCLDTVIISSPTDPPRHMYTLNIPSVNKMDYQKNTLALANYRNEILIYQFVQ